METRTETRKNRISTVLMIVCIASLLIYAVLAMCMKDEKRSSAENRKLLQYSAPDLQSFADGSWLKFIEEYSLDQCPGRDGILKAYFTLMDLSGIRERNGYLRCPDDSIVETPGTKLTYTKKQIKKYVSSRTEALAKLNDVCASSGSVLIYLEIPHKNTYFSASYPSLYRNPVEKYEKRKDSLLQSLDERKIDYVDTSGLLLHEHKDEYLYFRTDNHYTFLGAYYVYQALLDHINATYGEHLGFPQWENCEYKKSPAPLVGNYLKRFGDSGWIREDYIEYALPADMPSYQRFDNGKKSKTKVVTDDFSGFTDCFMGDNIANTVVKTNRPDLPNILLIGYSYTNALETLSVYSFNEIHSIDPREYEGSVTEYIETKGIDYVVVVRDDLYEGNKQDKATI